MSGKKTGNHQIGGDKKTRDKMNRNNPRGSKRGGLVRGKKKSPTVRFRTVNQKWIGADHNKIVGVTRKTILAIP